MLEVPAEFHRVGRWTEPERLEKGTCPWARGSQDPGDSGLRAHELSHQASPYASMPEGRSYDDHGEIAVRQGVGDRPGKTDDLISLDCDECLRCRYQAGEPGIVAQAVLPAIGAEQGSQRSEVRRGGRAVVHGIYRIEGRRSTATAERRRSIARLIDG